LRQIEGSVVEAHVGRISGIDRARRGRPLLLGPGLLRHRDPPATWAHHPSDHVV